MAHASIELPLGADTTILQVIRSELDLMVTAAMDRDLLFRSGCRLGIIRLASFRRPCNSLLLMKDGVMVFLTPLASVWGLTLNCSVPSPEAIETGIPRCESVSLLGYRHRLELGTDVERMFLCLTQGTVPWRRTGCEMSCHILGRLLRGSNKVWRLLVCAFIISGPCPLIQKLQDSFTIWYLLCTIFAGFSPGKGCGWIELQLIMNWGSGGCSKVLSALRFCSMVSWSFLSSFPILSFIFGYSTITLMYASWIALGWSYLFLRQVMASSYWSPVWESPSMTWAAGPLLTACLR